MKTRFIITNVLLVLICSLSGQAESEFFKSFKDNYSQLGSNLAVKPPAELAEISDFVYEKDAATFTFKQGKIYLLRHLEGRPTTAIFLGEGYADIDIPSHNERQNLWYASGDSLVADTFEVAFINFSDDFDLRLKEKFEFKETVLGWGDFNRAQQGEFFFKPVVMHEYDNYFQLLRSLYERAEDGFFWIDFNRYVFSFDSNRPEEVIVAYEHEGGDQDVTSGAVMMRQEKRVNDDYRLSDIQYPTTVLSREGKLVMAGLDGKVIDDAVIDISLLINKDSLRFLSLFLHYNLKLDSMYYNGQSIDYWRRGSFTFTGAILPEYRYKGDTVTLRLWYHGKDYHPAFPFVKNPMSSPHILTFDVPAGFNYAMPGMRPIASPDSRRERFSAVPDTPFRMFLFQPYASGFDTVSVVSDIGITLNYLHSKHINKRRFEHFIPDDYYRATCLEVFNFLSGRFGLPLGAFEVWIYPAMGISMPGLMGAPHVQQLIDGTGGLHMTAGNAAARQWFGMLMQPKTDREFWLLEALPDYLSLMCVSSGVSPSVFFGELKRRRNQIYTIVENNDDIPLAAGQRLTGVHRMVKGSWVLHMLRYLMYDLEKPSDRSFLTFLNELKILINSAPFTNEDFIKLSEKHYGGDLDWFFQQWLYSRNFPEYQVEYSFEERSDGHYVIGDVSTRKAGSDFRMPVIMRVEAENGSSTYYREMIEGEQDNFELGPVAAKPAELIFNEFFGVLSKDKVKEK